MSSEGGESLGNGKHWDRCREMLTKFDTENIESWKDEIQTQLLVVRFLSFGMSFTKLLTFSQRPAYSPH